jgi:myo-inositol-1(or 4)-monophosphatase
MATDVDLAIERILRDELTRATPGIGVQGEEEGGPTSGTRWVIDPVDGTANLTHDIPLTGISLALVVDEDPLLGVIALPQLDRTYWAADGLGACRDGHPIRIAGPARLDEAIVAVGDYATTTSSPGPRPTRRSASSSTRRPTGSASSASGTASPTPPAWAAHRNRCGSTRTPNSRPSA